jgi:hypothetical protein
MKEDIFDRPEGLQYYSLPKLIEYLLAYNRNGVFNKIHHDELVGYLRKCEAK